MRTTIDLDDSLFKKSKITAAMKGITLKEFITLAIAHELETDKTHLENRKVKLPLVSSPNPGSLDIDSEILAAVLVQEDLHVFIGH